MHRSFVVSVALGLALASAPTLLAQKASISPQLGIYIPTQHLVEMAGGDMGELEVGPSFGARLGVWFGDRFGIEATGNYVPTTFAFSEAAESPTQRNAKLVTGAGQMVLFLLPRTSILTVYLNGGLGLVRRSGDAFTNSPSRSDLSGVFGGGVGVRLGGMQLTGGADLYAYNADNQGTGGRSSLGQRDIQLRLGLDFPMGGATDGGQP